MIRLKPIWKKIEELNLKRNNILGTGFVVVLRVRSENLHTYK